MFPSLYQINTRVWLSELSRRLGRRATLDDIPDAELDQVAGQGFDWVWLLSVWQTGAAGREVSRSHAGWRQEFAETLPDLCDDDICGSGFAITAYSIAPPLGGEAALARLRQRLHRRAILLMLDFVPNHTALDHPWSTSHPEFFVSGTEHELARSPDNFIHIRRPAGDVILARGRDPYFPAWPDTLQLNYGNPATQDAMVAELLHVARQCDGVRCDMAMLLLPNVFQRTWGIPAAPFWPHAIERVRRQTPDFCFLAEVYWDLEWTMQQLGFDFTYDKRLYDRLRAGQASPVREHLDADLAYQGKLARFLENHDEPRAAAAFAAERHKAAAGIAYLSPGMRFLHHGQVEGRRKRISPHLGRGPDEPIDGELSAFYAQLLALLRRPVFRLGDWQLLRCEPAAPGNGSCDAFVASVWTYAEERVLMAVNYSPQRAQCRVRLPYSDLSARHWLLHDLLGTESYERSGSELNARGLYLDVPAWHCNVFELRRL